MRDSMSSEELRILVETSSEIILYFGLNGNVTYINTIAVNALGVNGLEELNIATVFPAVFSMEDGRLVFDRDILGIESSYMAYRQNNTCFRAVGKFAEDGRGGFLCVLIDVSGYDSLERELSSIKENAADVNKIKDEFVANVTHELRTPVNGIQGNTRELLTHDLEPDEVKTLKLIERGCEDMHSLINNILDFSKLEAGKFQLEPREFVFRDMIEYVRSNHINKIQEKGLNFFITISPDIPERLIGDELRIAQILNNLLSNATKFTSVGKVMLEAVTTKTVLNRMELFFMVVDTGIGIDKKDQDKLFKSFSQVEASISRRFGGTGLGLNISKQLVELMGGSIGVESTLGKGTMFTFSIWLDVPEDEKVMELTSNSVGPSFASLATMEEEDRTKQFGSRENKDEIKKRLMKLNLCIDMATWDKAEVYTDAIKQLTDGAPHEIKTAVLKLKMAVQKENVEKAIASADTLTILLGE